jgi:hypothetical protein
MSRTIWEDLVAFMDEGDGTAVANSTNELSLWDIVVPSRYMNNARQMRLRVIGKYSTTGTPTLTFRLRWGGVAGVVLCASAAITTPSGVTNAMWEADILLTVRSNGITGTMMVNGKVIVFAAVAPTVASATGGAAVTPMTAGGVTVPAVAVTDLTIDKTLSFTAQWSAASSSNTTAALQGELTSQN